jgi:hypothetical protein
MLFCTNLAGAKHFTTDTDIFYSRSCDRLYILLAALHLQKSPAGTMLPQHGSSWIQPLSTQSQLCQQKIRLQSLQMERERLKLRQQEIMRQVVPWFVVLCGLSPCCEAGSCLASYEVPYTLWNHVQKSLPLVHTLPSSFLKVHFI